jgi:hypothetical protein
MLDQRGQLLRAAVGFAGCSMPSYDRALWALRTWLDSWPGIGHVAVGMHRQGFDLQLTQYDDRGWRRDGTLCDQRDGHWMGADTVARGAARGVGGAQAGRLRNVIPLAASSRPDDPKSSHSCA